jgi:HAD superfamily hydrolase (TIGR01450 family)
MNFVLSGQAGGLSDQGLVDQPWGRSRAIAHVLLDWDGCVAYGNKPVAEAVAFIREWSGRVAIVSNNSTNLPEDFARILSQAGAEVAPSHIFLAGAEALKRACELRPKRVMVLGDTRLKAHARKLGLSLTVDKADLVILLRDTRFSYAKLVRAIDSLRSGAHLIIANPDMHHPGSDGTLVPETGALLAAIKAGLEGTTFSSEIIGKPSWRLFERACQQLGAVRETTLMIGDNPSTDLAGATGFGLNGLLVGPHSHLSFRDLLGQAPA